MDRYLCIHGHFYQPPRENPWLEAIEIQDSARPYHDWNERVTAECYAPNASSRILDEEGRIVNIVSNYSRISFNFGPTVLSWMEQNAPDVYHAILEADRQSKEWRSGHGNALAQVYNHIIMPLANRRDKQTQVIWGIKDFESRFKRFPEGMWLPETAVDYETLEVLAENGIMFTVLAPHQASRVRKLRTSKWRDVSGARIDPTRAYACRLPSGRSITIFFYDGPLSQAVAFENLLNKGEDFANRLLSGFSDTRDWPQIMNIATDGETYGHHHRFGDMALAYALNYVEENGLARLSNYGEYLDQHPPTHEVQIFDDTSWSCVHGIQRWKSNCGCNTGTNPDWHQEWRTPLRDALDWLREQLAFRYEHMIKEYLRNPWHVRDAYINIILDRSKEHVYDFVHTHAKRNVDNGEMVTVLKLLEIQRDALLMYTSCGWFFDDLSGIETIQILQYAGRALQLYEFISGDTSLEKAFLDKLKRATSNISDQGDGTGIYKKNVTGSMIDPKTVGIHYAVSSLFEEYTDKTVIYCYEVNREDYQKIQSGHARLAVGKISIISHITWMSEDISFCVLHLGSHVINGGAHTFKGDDEYQTMKQEIIAAFETGEFIEIVRLMDMYFGTHSYSLRDLFRDEQRKILTLDISSTLEELETTYRSMYDNNNILMGFLKEVGMPIPPAFYTTAEFILNFDMQKAFSDDGIDAERIRQIIQDVQKWNIPLATEELEFAIRGKMAAFIDELLINPSNAPLLVEIRELMELLNALPVDVNLWHVQNVYYKLARTVYKDFLLRARTGEEDAEQWVTVFRDLGERLFFNIAAIFDEGSPHA
jgi:alpha-amylase/alpha-mannosidase (GH57 family)